MNNTVTWNPWRGCHRCSEGCLRCENVGPVIRNKNNFRLPVQKVRVKGVHRNEYPYKVESNSLIEVCRTSDFFIEEADVMRVDAWKYIHERYDCLFHIVTRRIGRAEQCFPETWFSGWDNVMISVAVESDDSAWTKIPVLLELPIKHMGIVIEPLLEDIDISPFLSSGSIENVMVGGESYIGYDGLARSTRLEWVENIQKQCKEYNTNFTFHQTGTRLTLKDNRIVTVQKRDESPLADFYKLDYVDESIGDWEANIEDIQERALTEMAYNIYKKVSTNKTEFSNQIKR